MGQGGGIKKYVRIYKRREETNSEYNARIAKEESECLDKFKDKLYFLIEDLIHDFNIYPNVRDKHINDIEDAVMDIVKEKLNNSNKKK